MKINTETLTKPILRNYSLPNPYGHGPLRRANSVRRTATIDVTWPNGKGNDANFQGRGRDILTIDPSQQPRVLREDTLSAIIDNKRTIKEISSNPPRDNIGELVGARGGGYLRQKLNDTLPEEQISGSPLYLMIDDLSGVSLVSAWAWSRWPQYRPELSEKELAQRLKTIQSMENICTGFKSKNSTIEEKTNMQAHHCSVVLSLNNPDDPAGWHALIQHKDVSMRRARRIDVWIDIDNSDICIEATFQDSASTPDGDRVAVHEYSLNLVADHHSQKITNLLATPHVLPFTGCPEAIENIQRLVGTPRTTH